MSRRKQRRCADAAIISFVHSSRADDRNAGTEAELRGSRTGQQRQFAPERSKVSTASAAPSAAINFRPIAIGIIERLPQREISSMISPVVTATRYRLSRRPADVDETRVVVERSVVSRFASARRPKSRSIETFVRTSHYSSSGRTSCEICYELPGRGLRGANRRPNASCRRAVKVERPRGRRSTMKPWSVDCPPLRQIYARRWSAGRGNRYRGRLGGHARLLLDRRAEIDNSAWRRWPQACRHELRSAPAPGRGSPGRGSSRRTADPRSVRVHEERPSMAGILAKPSTPGLFYEGVPRDCSRASPAGPPRPRSALERVVVTAQPHDDFKRRHRPRDPIAPAGLLAAPAQHERAASSASVGSRTVNVDRADLRGASGLPKRTRSPSARRVRWPASVSSDGVVSRGRSPARRRVRRRVFWCAIPRSKPASAHQHDDLRRRGRRRAAPRVGYSAAASPSITARSSARLHALGP